MSIIAGAFGVGNIIGPQTFQARDAPQYLPAKITVLAAVCAGAGVAAVLMGYYKWENKRRDREQEGKTGETDEEVWSNLTDRENRSFRYVT